MMLRWRIKIKKRQRKGHPITLKCFGVNKWESIVSYLYNVPSSTAAERLSRESVLLYTQTLMFFIVSLLNFFSSTTNCLITNMTLVACSAESTNHTTNNTLTMTIHVATFLYEKKCRLRIIVMLFMTVNLQYHTYHAYFPQQSNIKHLSEKNVIKIHCCRKAFLLQKQLKKEGKDDKQIWEFTNLPFY